MCFSKRGIFWRFVIKICLINRSTEVIRTQWQNFLQDPRKREYPQNTFLISPWKHMLWVSFEAPQRGASNEYNNICFCREIKYQYSSITKTCPFKYTENFTTKKWKFSDKDTDIFHISAQNIDCGYTLEPPRRGGSNKYHNLYFWAEIRKVMYTPVNPSFNI